MANGQDFGSGLWSGAKMGFISGTISGFGNAVQFTNKNNVNLFSGKPNPVMERAFVPQALPIPKGGINVSESSKSISPKVQEALNTLNDLESNGATIKMNSLNDNRDLNMTIKYNDQKLDMRIESHPLPFKYGGDGITPTPHLNLDLTPRIQPGLPNNGHVILR